MSRLGTWLVALARLALLAVGVLVYWLLWISTAAEGDTP